MVCALQDLASQAVEVAKGTKGLDEVVDAIREHEMAILNSLVSSKELAQLHVMAETRMPVTKAPGSRAAPYAQLSHNICRCLAPRQGSGTRPVLAAAFCAGQTFTARA